MKKGIWAALPVLVVVLALASPAAASTFLAMSTGELVAQSDAVVTGTVIRVESFRDASGRAILTEAMVQVDETLLGDAPSVAVVRTFGGTVDGYTVVAHGFPKFEQGDRLLVFLSNQPDGSAEVVGYRLGQYKLLVNRFGDEIAVPTLEPGVRLLTREGAMAARPQAMRLETLKQTIRNEARVLHRGDNF